ncbi:MAG: hypothetical protein ACI3V4_02655 [Faecousia sp.]
MAEKKSAPQEWGADMVKWVRRLINSQPSGIDNHWLKPATEYRLRMEQMRSRKKAAERKLDYLNWPSDVVDLKQMVSSNFPEGTLLQDYLITVEGSNLC